ncbi:ribosomal-protein-alanine N-acetyltransferase [Mucilaginibacter gossypiicola]|uniref:Ribosomal-protein-alanine N-acetyltransferase n=1 Tax=Mucilaginibacter gossypiicola TaxID=551995 RepID=A0A1H8GAI4_9SPHI|nr:GNAT family N-acetyltransferase [Mucilaginibacter gossypiicola]SEN41161.1 ribosomal-protein-alanine N-acetyltransferase [Mucilaginibacter gossypiicola]
MNTPEMPTLVTDRLNLRGLLESDALQIMALRSNAEVNKYLDRPSDTTIEQALSFINKIGEIVSGGNGFYWGITLKNKPELIGTICYWNLNPADKKAEIGYELHPAYQGRGYMREAVSTVLEAGFNKLGFELVTACPQQANKSSHSLLKKKGFSLTGDFTDEETGSKYFEFRLVKGHYLKNLS